MKLLAKWFVLTDFIQPYYIVAFETFAAIVFITSLFHSNPTWKLVLYIIALCILAWRLPVDTIDMIKDIKKRLAK